MGVLDQSCGSGVDYEIIKRLGCHYRRSRAGDRGPDTRRQSRCARLGREREAGETGAISEQGLNAEAGRCGDAPSARPPNRLRLVSRDIGSERNIGFITHGALFQAGPVTQPLTIFAQIASVGATQLEGVAVTTVGVDDQWNQSLRLLYGAEEPVLIQEIICAQYWMTTSLENGQGESKVLKSLEW